MSKRVVLAEYTLSSAKIKEPVTVVQVSDLHERKSEEVCALLGQVKPDLIVMTGDILERFSDDCRRPDRLMRLSAAHRLFLRTAFNINYFFIHVVRRKDLPLTENSYRLLTCAASIAPVFLSLGNHEEELRDEDFALFRAHGITLLDNADTSVSVKGSLFRIGGLSTMADEDWLKRFAEQEGFKLLLCHHPEYYDKLIADKAVDLTLSGHNHGGQIRLFGKGLLSSGGGLFPKYDRGVFHGRLVVSAGCSNTVAMPRWGNPREVTVIRLLPATQPKRGDSAEKP